MHRRTYVSVLSGVYMCCVYTFREYRVARRKSGTKGTKRANAQHESRLGSYPRLPALFCFSFSLFLRVIRPRSSGSSRESRLLPWQHKCGTPSLPKATGRERDGRKKLPCSSLALSLAFSRRPSPALFLFLSLVCVYLVLLLAPIRCSKNQ